VVDEDDRPSGQRDAAHEVVIEVVGPVGRGDVGRWCVHTAAVVRHVPSGAAVVCDVSRLGPPDLVAVEVLARIQLAAHRSGHRVRFRGACPRLRALLRRAGLDAVLPIEPTR
jgi:hypothetical protein